MNTYGSYTSCVSYINMHGTSCCMKDMHVYKKKQEIYTKEMHICNTVHTITKQVCYSQSFNNWVLAYFKYALPRVSFA